MADVPVEKIGSGRFSIMRDGSMAARSARVVVPVWIQVLFGLVSVILIARKVPMACSN